MKVLIISDGRVGHQSQSEAFCKFKGFKYEIVLVSYPYKIIKILSYILDFFGIYLPIFKYRYPKLDRYELVISAGSTTYYANKFFARKFKTKNIALMLPKGFRNDFDLVFTTFHDIKYNKKNIITLPVNINYLNENSYYKPQKKAIGFIIGGNNKSFFMDKTIIKTINDIKSKFIDYEFLITTSPRTPNFIKDELDENKFDFFVLYNRDKINPIYDFLKYCEFVFITQDSVSMISEAVCNLKASVVILPLQKKEKRNKFDDFIEYLKKEKFVILYETNMIFYKTKKINLKEIISKVKF